MQKQKYISLLIMWAGILVPTLSSHAQMLMPSLQAQMQRQTTVDARYAQDKARMYNEQRLKEIREANEKRVRRLQQQEESQNTPIDIAAKEQALSRPVTRIIRPFVWQQQNNYDNFKNNPQHITLTSAPTERNINNIDLIRVEKEWLSWVNNLRSQSGLHPYTQDSRLSDTAQEWSEFSKNRGYIIHGRPGDGCVGETNYHCYNFPAIDQWFKERWINPQIIGRSKHTENLWIGSYRCNSGDCTQSAINAIKKTYNFFLSEKSYNGVHYRTMISPNFTKMWLGLSIKNGTYYLTIHYTNDF